MKNREMELFFMAAMEAAWKASDLVMQVYRQDFDVLTKNDQSPVTEADLKADACIRETLDSTGLYVLSEEVTPLDYTRRAAMKYLWIVDPLDGTKEFIKRNGEFTVNIALIKNGRPVIGIVTAPALHTLYWGMQGKGSFEIKNCHWNDHSNIPAFEGKKLEPNITSVMRIVGSRSHQSEANQQYIKKLTQTFTSNQIITGGSSLKFCKLASGEADIYPRFSPINEWDIAAGVAIVEQSGGYVLDAHTSEPVIFNKNDLRQPPFIAANGYINKQDLF